MNEIDKYLDEVCRTLGGSRDLREHVREEIRDHLIDAVEANVAKGLSKEDATRKAIEDFGKPEETKSGLEALYGHSLTAFLVDRAMAWKERNMKSGWKWSFAAMTILIIVITAELLLSLACFVFIFPRLRENYEMLSEPFPALPQSALKVGLFLYDQPWGCLLLVAVLAAWALFEWRSGSENKAVIRLTCAACAALATAAVFAFTATATIVGLAEAASLNYLQDPRPVALTRIANGAKAMARLQDAMQAGDRDMVHSASDDLRDAMEWLRTPRTIHGLIPTKDPRQFERIQSLLDTMHEQNHRGRNLSQQEGFDKLRKTWGLFLKEIEYDSSATPAPEARDIGAGEQ